MSNAFCNIKSKEELADFLKLSQQKLDFNAYSINRKYTVFYINKKSGGQRKILAPIHSLKVIQRVIARELNDLYTPKKHVHSYLPKKSIKSNAKVHVNQRYVINIDLEDFFQSINFGRVYGLFKSHPFRFNDKISSILAQLCCHENELPQGSPSSPIISNLICRKLDNELSAFARKNKCYYTRYSDDITFSTNTKKVSNSILKLHNKELSIGQELREIIENNGFKINSNKISIRRKHENQYATGLTINKKVNVKKKFIKQLRGMLHAWEKFGLNLASKEHFKKYSSKHRDKDDPELFMNIIFGKLLFLSAIRGKDDKLVISMFSKFRILRPYNQFIQYLSYSGEKIQVFCEGNTDWMHLKHALDKLCVTQYKYVSLRNNIKIVEYDHNISVGDSKLKQILESHLLSRNPSPIIGIFDSDNLGALGQFRPNKQFKYKNFNNTVFVFTLPKPTHRSNNKVCIEHYYKNEDLMIKDENGRRIFLSDEFDSQNAIHKNNESLRFTGNFNKIKQNENIIDADVRNSNDDSFALSKKSFALNILNKEEKFKKVDVNSFRLIFDQILAIISDYQKNSVEKSSD